MELLHDRRDRLADDAAVAATIGVFDGVHLVTRRSSGRSEPPPTGSACVRRL